MAAFPPPAVLESVSLDKFIPESPSCSEPGDLSPCRSPSTPRHLRYRQTGGTAWTQTPCCLSTFCLFNVSCSHQDQPGRTLAAPCRRPRRSPSPRLLRVTAARRVSSRGFRWGSNVMKSFNSSSLSGFSNSEKTCDKEFIIRRAATNRVLNVLRHWVSKHSQVGHGEVTARSQRGHGEVTPFIWFLKPQTDIFDALTGGNDLFLFTVGRHFIS